LEKTLKIAKNAKTIQNSKKLQNIKMQKNDIFLKIAKNHGHDFPEGQVMIYLIFK